MRNDNIRVRGRFNFVYFKKDFYNIVFVPFNGGMYSVIAENLNFKDMQEYLVDLNEITNDIYKLSKENEQFAEVTDSELSE